MYASMSLVCCGPSEDTGTGALYVDSSQRGLMPGSSPVAHEHVTSFAVGEIQQHEIGLSPCGNIIAPARVDEGSAPSRSKSPVFVAFQRVSPFVSLICMLPDRSMRKSTFPAAGEAGYAPVAAGQIGAAASACVIGGGGFPAS